MIDVNSLKYTVNDIIHKHIPRHIDGFQIEPVVTYYDDIVEKINVKLCAINYTRHNVQFAEQADFLLPTTSDDIFIVISHMLCNLITNIVMDNNSRKENTNEGIRNNPR